MAYRNNKDGTIKMVWAYTQIGERWVSTCKGKGRPRNIWSGEIV